MKFRPPPPYPVLSFSLGPIFFLHSAPFTSLSFPSQMINTATGAQQVYCLPAAATYGSLFLRLLASFHLWHLHLLVIFCLPSCSSFTSDRPLPMRQKLRPSHCDTAMQPRKHAQDISAGRQSSLPIANQSWEINTRFFESIFSFKENTNWSQNPDTNDAWNWCLHFNLASICNIDYRKNYLITSNICVFYTRVIANYNLLCHGTTEERNVIAKTIMVRLLCALKDADRFHAFHDSKRTSSAAEIFFLFPHCQSPRKARITFAEAHLISLKVNRGSQRGRREWYGISPTDSRKEEIEIGSIYSEVSMESVVLEQIARIGYIMEPLHRLPSLVRKELIGFLRFGKLSLLNYDRSECSQKVRLFFR